MVFRKLFGAPNADDVKKLGQEKNIKALVKILFSKNRSNAWEQARCYATECLIACGDVSAVELIINQDEWSFYFAGTFKNAVNILGELGDVRAIDFLINWYKRSELNEKSKAELIKYLKDERTETVDSFSRVSHPIIVSIRNRQAILIALEKLQDYRAIDVFMGALYDIYVPIKLIAVRALGQFRGQAVIDGLLFALKDKSSKVKEAAAEALDKLGSGNYIPKDSSSIIKDEASEELLKMGHGYVNAEVTEQLLADLKLGSRTEKPGLLLEKYGDISAIAPMVAYLQQAPADIHITKALATTTMRYPDLDITVLNRVVDILILNYPYHAPYKHDCVEPVAQLFTMIYPRLDKMRQTQVAVMLHKDDLLTELGDDALAPLVDMLQSDEIYITTFVAGVLYRRGWADNDLKRAQLAIARNNWDALKTYGASAVDALIEALGFTTSRKLEKIIEVLLKFKNERASKPISQSFSKLLNRSDKDPYLLAFHELGWKPHSLEYEARLAILLNDWQALENLGANAVGELLYLTNDEKNVFYALSILEIILRDREQASQIEEQYLESLMIIKDLKGYVPHIFDPKYYDADDYGYRKIDILHHEQGYIANRQKFISQLTFPFEDLKGYCFTIQEIASNEFQRRKLAKLTDAINHDPQNAQLYYQRGMIYFSGGRDITNYNDAITNFTQAIKHNAKLIHAYYYRGIIHNIQRNYDDAIADFDKVLSIDGNHIQAYYERGLAYYEKEDYDKAISDFNRALQLNPNLDDAIRKRDNALSKRRK